MFILHVMWSMFTAAFYSGWYPENSDERTFYEMLAELNEELLVKSVPSGVQEYFWTIVLYVTLPVCTAILLAEELLFKPVETRFAR